MRLISFIFAAYILLGCANGGQLNYSREHRLESYANLQYLSCDTTKYYPGKKICCDIKKNKEKKNKETISLSENQDCKAGIYYKPDEKKSEMARKSYLYALLSNNVYRDSVSKPIFWIAGLNYPIRYESESGLAIEEYRLLNAADELKEIIVIYKGTDFSSVDDWKANLAIKNNAPLQYQEAERHMNLVYKLANENNVKVSVAGHSLGGGIALYISYKFDGVDAFAFNTSPRNFSEIDGANNNNRYIISESGEILAAVRKLWKQISLNEPVTYNFQAYNNFLTKTINEHSIYNISRGLLLYAATTGNLQAASIFTDNMLRPGYTHEFSKRKEFIKYKGFDLDSCEKIKAMAIKYKRNAVSHKIIDLVKTPAFITLTD